MRRVPSTIADIMGSRSRQILAALSPLHRRFIANRNVFSLKLFGGASIQSPTGPLEGRAAQRRRLGLLALLAAPRQAGTGQHAVGVSRERLVAYLWPEAESDRGRHLLSDSVYRINQALGAEAISTAGDELRLNAVVLPSDVAELEDAVARGEHARVVSLYAGPFLDGIFLADSTEFERWVDSTRERFSRQYAASLEALADEAARTRDAAGAVDWWRRLAVHDIYNSRIAVRLIAALDATGARAAALRHAEIHTTLLRAELDAEPDPAFVALVERMRASPAAMPATTPTAPTETVSAQPAERVDPSPVRSLVHVPTIEYERHEPPLIPTGRPRWVAGFAFACAAVAMLAVFVSAGAKRIERLPTSPNGVSIAVLPFTDVSEQHDNEYFSDGMTEELMNTLAKLPDVRVASRTSALVYKGRAADVREVGQKLGVGTVLEGSVRRSGSKLRITVRLVSAGDGYQLWSDAYERRVSDDFAVQEEIATTIAANLRGRLLQTKGLTPVREPTTDTIVRELAPRERFAWQR